MPDIYLRIEDWRKRLLDLSKRNRLINCKIGSRGAIDLVHPLPDVIWQELVSSGRKMVFPWKTQLLGEEMRTEETPAQGSTFVEAESAEPGQNRSSEVELDACIKSRRLKANHVLTNFADRTLATRLNRLGLNTKTSITEQGVNVLYLGFGLLKWYESADSDIAMYSPLLLVPARLDRAGPEATWDLLLYEEDVVPNQCLHELLKADFRLGLPAIPDQGLDSPDDRKAHFQKVRKTLGKAGGNPRWEVLDKVVLGIFSFQKLAMWQDLKVNEEHIAAHDLCRAIAGDRTACTSATTDLPADGELDDRVHPKDVYTILDADTYQLAAILAVDRGMSVVLDGPPGTGKSQTIANMIAQAIANGKKVLFVSEKAAALEVVKRRLDKCKLGDFCLECHSHKANKKEVIEELGRCLDLPMEGYADQNEDLDRLYRLRQRLNSYVRALHESRGAMQMTAYAVHGRLARLGPHRISQCPVSNVLEMNRSMLDHILERLRSLVDCRDVVEHYDRHPWRGCRVEAFSFALQDRIQHDFQQLAKEIDDCAGPVAFLAGHGLLSDQPSTAMVLAGLDYLERVLQVPQLPASWFCRDPRQTASVAAKLYAGVLKYQKTWRQLPEFRSEAMDADCDHLLATLSDLPSDWISRWRRSPLGSLRKEQIQLKKIADDLAKLAFLVGKVPVSVDRLCAILQVPAEPNAALDVITRLPVLAQAVLQTGELRESWFDDTRRATLQGTAARCQHELQAAEDLRKRLELRMTPVAFGSEGEEVAQTAAALSSFWSRLGGRLSGRWSHFTARAVPLYRHRSGARSMRPLIDDMSLLRQYHLHRNAAKTLEAACGTDLIRDEHGQVCWDAFASGVAAIDRIRSLTEIPEQLKQALLVAGKIDCSALQAEMDALHSLLRDADAEVTRINGEFDLTRLGQAGRDFRSLSAMEFAALLHTAESEVRGLAAAYDAVSRLLLDDADLPMSQLGPKFDKLAKLRQLRTEIDRLRAELAGLPDLPSSFEPTVWAPLAEMASCVSAFLDAYGSPPPECVVAVVTNADLRDAVANACSQLRALTSPAEHTAWSTLQSCFVTNEPVSAGLVIDQTPLLELATWLRERAADAERLREWMRYCETEQALRRLDAWHVLKEVRDGEIAVEEAEQAFLKRFYRTWLDAAYHADQTLRGFRVPDHDRLIEEFRKLDRDVVRGGYRRIRSKLLQDPERPHRGQLTAPPSSELGILMREVNKRRRHVPLRQLFQRIPTVLPRLKPCVMMSPLAVSTYLDSPAIRFDLVIFDEASQVRPEDAIGAVYRGRQLVVAGDQKQLPPTSFFDRLASDEDVDDEEEDVDEGSLGGLESILDVCGSVGMLPKRLLWHYRSRREPLIAFSNHHFYGNTLITSPSVFDAESKTAVSLHFVPDGRWRPGRGTGGNNPEEARQTAALVFKHFEEFPEKSLGVITFNLRQMDAVYAELEQMRRARPEMEEFFRDERDEPFFVKNLEIVQGDERDRIILSVGYGYDERGKFAKNFGPLNKQGGERRLNVAVTRAREQVVLVSSVHATDLSLTGTRSVGSRLLRAYLDYAEHGPTTLGPPTTAEGGEPDSEFESEVERMLKAEGLNVQRQVGCAGYRIDLALVHPENPARYVLGIECDGATYHSSATARDRDRLRQEILEGLGWKICRIWSTDWVRDPKPQIHKVVDAYKKAVSEAAGDANDRKGDPEEPDAVDSHARVVHPPSGIGYGLDLTPAKPPKPPSIADVPPETLRKVTLELLREFGQMSREDLIRAVARRLGFERASKKRRHRIGQNLSQMLRTKAIKRTTEGKLCIS